MKKFDPIGAIEALQFTGQFAGINPSISDSSTYLFESAQKMADTFEGLTEDSFLYSRHSSPNTMFLGEALAKLEGTEAANVTASGMAAISATLLQLCKTGDHIVSSRTVYGGTYALMKYFLPKFGIKTIFVDARKPEAFQKAITTKTKIIYCETVSNPLLEIADIPEIAKIAKKAEAKLVVDNTFSPLSMAPAKMGADIVVHSLTKYINGAGDAIGGVVCGNTDFIDSMRSVIDGATMLLGPTMDNVRSATILKNLSTLHIRIKQHAKNAAYLAKQLKKDGVKVIYPGLDNHRSHELFKEIGNMEFGFGGMISIETNSKENAYKLMEMLQEKNKGLLAVSLGYYKTLFNAPGTGTSSEIPEEEREEMGLTNGLIRLSIGLDNNIENTYQVMKECMQEIGII